VPPADQCRLLTWLEMSGGRIQVVSTTTSPLLPLVESGVFHDTLYYRLNVVCVDLTT
jgi:transcriptional regulator of acetoin/glycerol metabolism